MWYIRKEYRINIGVIKETLSQNVFLNQIGYIFGKRKRGKKQGSAAFQQKEASCCDCISEVCNAYIYYIAIGHALYLERECEVGEDMRWVRKQTDQNLEGGQDGKKKYIRIFVFSNVDFVSYPR